MRTVVSNYLRVSKFYQHAICLLPFNNLFYSALGGYNPIIPAEIWDARNIPEDRALIIDQSSNSYTALPHSSYLYDLRTEFNNNLLDHSNYKNNNVMDEIPDNLAGSLSSTSARVKEEENHQKQNLRFPGFEGNSHARARTLVQNLRLDTTENIDYHSHLIKQEFQHDDCPIGLQFREKQDCNFSGKQLTVADLFQAQNPYLDHDYIPVEKMLADLPQPNLDFLKEIPQVQESHHSTSFLFPNPRASEMIMSRNKKNQDLLSKSLSNTKTSINKKPTSTLISEVPENQSISSTLKEYVNKNWLQGANQNNKKLIVNSLNIKEEKMYNYQNSQSSHGLLINKKKADSKNCLQIDNKQSAPLSFKTKYLSFLPEDKLNKIKSEKKKY
ncbi:hypothetical protein BY996DRAFT_7430327 [Phakopsora pachyrhizi]|nr:hypothetical protein BY996DRAFT_7430327 [Phakopsora pachyrhizi]